GPSEEGGGGEGGGAALSEITVAATSDFESIDPFVYTSNGANLILRNVYEGLATYKEDGTVTEGLAQSWMKATPDGKEWLIQVKMAVKFHDGVQITIDDVIYSVKKGAEMIPELAGKVADVYSKGSFGVNIVLTEPMENLPQYLTFPIVRANSNLADVANANGTGAYKLTAYEKGVGCTLERNDRYYQKPAKIEKINVKFYADSAAALAALGNGEAHIAAISADDTAPDTCNVYAAPEGAADGVLGAAVDKRIEGFSAYAVPWWNFRTLTIAE
ncbi:MAG: hypothetical protein IJO79_05885, partial [Firmicutes bacterium]|nr:hypothetical protein [Bacillota bacterium]